MSKNEYSVEKWVRRLNAAGRRLDEIASSMHPSAWPEALRAEREAWKRLARRMP